MPRKIGRNELNNLDFRVDTNNQPTAEFANYHGVNDPVGVHGTRSRGAARRAPYKRPLPRPNGIAIPHPPRLTRGADMFPPPVPQHPPRPSHLGHAIPPPSPDGLIPPHGVDDGVRVVGQMSEGPATGAEGDPRFLYSAAFATCTGVAISGTYPYPGYIPHIWRNERFLVHMMEEFWWEDFSELRAHLVLARAWGLQDLQIHVLAMQPDSQPNYSEDPCEVMVEIQKTYKAQRRLMRELRGILGADPDGSDHHPRIHWYPYTYNDLPGASIALFADGTFLANHENGVEQWALSEVQWNNWPKEPVPRGTPWRPIANDDDNDAESSS